MDIALVDTKAQLYDRQIRLWGLDGQERLSSSHILFIGCTSLNCEAAKNLVLTGVNISLCPGIMDERPSPIISAHFMTNCLVPFKNKANTYLNRLEKIAKDTVDALKNINSFCSITLVSLKEWNTMFEEIQKGCNALAQFTGIVIDLWSLPRHHLDIVNSSCRDNNKGFFISQGMGFHGAVFQDITSRTLSNDPIKHHAVFPSLKEVLRYPFASLSSGYKSERKKLPHEKLVAYLVFLRDQQEDLDSILKHVVLSIDSAGHTETTIALAKQWLTTIQDKRNVPFPTTSAVVAGVLEEIQMYISGGGRELHNIFIFDGDTCEGLIFNVGIQDTKVTQAEPIEEAML